MSNIDIIAFHGTDLNAAKSIVNSKFIVGNSDEYWLGRGAYFFIDESLAEWWTTSPSKTFGKKVKEPAIVNANIHVDDDSVLDLRKLKDYKEFVTVYSSEFLPDLLDGKVSIDVSPNVYTGLIDGTIDPNDTVTFKKIRCAYCNFLKSNYYLKALIGTFSLETQPYLSKNQGEYFKTFDIRYTETQLCIFDQTCITDKNYVSLASRLEV